MDDHHALKMKKTIEAWSKPTTNTPPQTSVLTSRACVKVKYLSHGTPPSHRFLSSLHATQEVLRLPARLLGLGSTGPGLAIITPPLCHIISMKR
jgi:hypothetical protein